jgi:hypothetical protein
MPAVPGIGLHLLPHVVKRPGSMGKMNRSPAAAVLFQL